MAERRIVAMAQREHVPTAMVFGKSGMGKSYLCNCLLDGSGYADEGFHTEPGADPITRECQVRTVERTDAPPCPPGSRQGSLKPGGPLRMIDTPGIPDPAGRTLQFYDQIVKTVQDTGGLNAFIMVINSTTDREHIRKDIETYRVLLAQFAKLPVFKVVVCRVRLERWASTERRNKHFESIKTWITEILDKGGMASAEQVYIRQDETMMLQYFELRSLVADMPWAPVGDWNMKTSAELRESAKRLIDLDTRTEELREKKRSLLIQKGALDESIAKLQGKVDKTGKKKGWSLAVAAATAATGVGLPLALGAGMAFFGVQANKKNHYRKQIATNEAWKNSFEQEIAGIVWELESGETNRAALEAERKALQDLERLAHIGRETEPS